MIEKKLLTYEEIMKEMKKSHQFWAESGFAGILDIDGRHVRVFRAENGLFAELDVKEMAKLIAEYLAKHITVEKLLQDKILHKPLVTILRLHKRMAMEGEVKEHKGCYYLTVKGEKGPAMELEL